MSPRLLDRLWEPRGPQGAGVRLLAGALAVPELLFRGGVAVRELLLRSGLLRATRVPVPVVSIGGLEVGGTGKTPLALELVRLAARAGLPAAVATRGYGARSPGSRSGGHAVWKVPDPPTADSAVRFGDEPVWLASRVGSSGGIGVWVAPHRILAARAAAASGARLVLLDDGLQHRRLRRDGEVVTLLAAAPFGNGRLLPRGPLREPAAQALRRADVVVLAGADAETETTGAALIRPLLRPATPIFSWRAVPALVPVVGDGPAAGEPVALLAGIAHPERLPESLGQLGLSAIETRFFHDHHRFGSRDLEGLVGVGAGKIPGVLVTTEKDWPRLRGVLPAGSRVALLVQSLRWNEPGAEAWWVDWLRGVSERVAGRVAGRGA
jgi:tetraacyldisaccharide 4'-kinase